MKNQNPTPDDSDKGNDLADRTEDERHFLEEAHGATVLSTLARKTFGTRLNASGYKAYRDTIVAAYGPARDPIEAMLLEQLIWAHFRIGDLQVQAAMAEVPQAVAIITSATAKLMAEFRKSVLAFQTLRSPPVRSQFTVVKQQNLAAGDQQVAFVEAPVDSVPSHAKNTDTKLGSNAGVLEHVELTKPFPATACGTPEPVIAARLHARRAPTTAGSRPCSSPVDKGEGSADGGR